jgi:predicted membrane metal-binding protein
LSIFSSCRSFGLTIAPSWISNLLIFGLFEQPRVCLLTWPCICGYRTANLAHPVLSLCGKFILIRKAKKVRNTGSKRLQLDIILSEALPMFARLAAEMDHTGENVNTIPL